MILKNCPFCNSKEALECADEKEQEFGNTNTLYQKRWIECLECGARGPYVYWDNINNCDEFAAEEWNKRALEGYARK